MRGDDDLGAFGLRQFRGGKADAGGAADNDYRFALKLHECALNHGAGAATNASRFTWETPQPRPAMRRAMKTT